MEIDYNQFLNPYDIIFLIIVIISVFFGIKNGLTKSIFNLIKWILIFFLIKNCFIYLRPYVDSYITNQTISDIVIFIFTFVTSYIVLSSVNRFIIGIIQPKRSGIIDLTFGAILGILRGYIIFVLIIFFINSNLSSSIPRFMTEGSFKNITDYGIKFLDRIPRELNDIDDLNI